MPILSFSAIALIWFQGSLQESENKCAAFDAPPPRGSLFLAPFSAPPFFFFFLLKISPAALRKWKPTFLVPPEATRPLQNTQLPPVNKYTKTFSHLGQSQADWANKQNNHGNRDVLLLLWIPTGSA